MLKTSSKGRMFKPGVRYPTSLKYKVIEMAATHSFKEISRELKIYPSTVANYVQSYRQTGTVDPPLKNNHQRSASKLSFQDSLLIETIVQTKGSSSLKEIAEALNMFGDCGEVSIATVSRHVRKKMPSARQYSRKRLGKCAIERFTHENLVYTQLYLDYFANKDPSTVKFFDETGFQLPDSGHRNCGYAPVGQQCIDIRRYLSTANITLNFLAGIDGVKYANIIPGASNSVEFLNFFDEALNTVDPNTRRPVLEVGDIIVVDNFAAHHGQAEQALRGAFENLGMTLLYLPTYSPDFNPVEEVFSKLKYLLKYRYHDITFHNLEYGVWSAIGDLEANDVYGYYRHAGYLV